MRLIGSRMTPEEKFWQLFMMPGDLDDPANDYSARAHAARVNAIQRYFIEGRGSESRRESSAIVRVSACRAVSRR